MSSAVRQFLAWWWSQLRGLLPARFAQADLYADAVIAEVRPGEADVTFVQRRKGREAALAPVRGEKAAAGARRMLLRAPGDAVLERRLALPAATAPELDQVLSYEIERISPFTAEEVAWAYEIEGREGERIQLALALVPRTALSAAVTGLRQAGASPTAVLAPKRGGGTWCLPLLTSGHSGRSLANRRALQAGVAACAVLAIVAVVLPFVQQERAFARADARIAALRPKIADAEALRKRIAERATGLDAVAAETARVGNALDALAALTGALPDDTYLTALTLRQRALTLTGRSASAARLIPLLAADPAFRNAAFAAPVTRVEGADGDVFSIRADLTP